MINCNAWRLTGKCDKPGQCTKVHDDALKGKYSSLLTTAKTHEEMAGKELRAVVERVADAHGVPRVRVVHRIGELGVGEASLGVACASVHRKESFACALEIIDELKKSVPIWKKEMGPEGTSWG